MGDVAQAACKGVSTAQPIGFASEAKNIGAAGIGNDECPPGGRPSAPAANTVERKQSDEVEEKRGDLCRHWCREDIGVFGGHGKRWRVVAGPNDDLSRNVGEVKEWTISRGCTVPWRLGAFERLVAIGELPCFVPSLRAEVGIDAAGWT